MSKKDFFVSLAFFALFVLVAWFSPVSSSYPVSDRILICVGGVLLCFVSPLIGRWFCVSVLHLPEWDKEEEDK